MYSMFRPEEMSFSRFLFFTGKGGVGKTSTASALAITLANLGKQVLIVSTDPASNLQDVFEIELTNNIISIPAVEGLFACNIDAEEAARQYREKVVEPYRGKLPDSVIQTMEEQMSGACTVEIAAFDEFTNLLTDAKIEATYDHIIFDTAPTGHTLRLLQLPMAWTDFLNESTHGASCLGPLSGLAEKKELYSKSVSTLSNPSKTTLFLVSRPEESTIHEAKRASMELREVGLENQILLINGVLQECIQTDEVSSAFYKKQQRALKEIPAELRELNIFEIPLVSFSLTGIDSLKKLFLIDKDPTSSFSSEIIKLELPPFEKLINDLHDRGIRIILTMGKGGVGKTAIASAIAVGLSEKGNRVHLTTTDPAAHLDNYFPEGMSSENLTISRIDPDVEVENYRNEVLNKVSTELDEQAIAYIKEDLESPCTEEIAIFKAFASVVDESKHEVVVIDTAPTGHTLLLLDAAQSYHKELERSTGEIPESVRELLPRLRNNKQTEVVIVTLPEATPVLEASRLQEDLERAHIYSNWWVVNQSFSATDTTDPILSRRAVSEQYWISKVKNKLAKHFSVIPWLKNETIGFEQLKKLVRK
ncbi:arsenical pump-driving ATPase [Cytobacillus sp. FJAT-54145]|uniref:Arsenical pump-driving ATPase n=1 Tax=Cytobacillus spartinae TaxID=3299023 RepID=A0ABW6KG82_9BACI